MGLTGLSQLPPSVHTRLGPGEEPLAWQMVDLCFGESRIGRQGPTKIVTDVDLNPITSLSGGPVEIDSGFFDRLVGGVSLTGHVSSTADTLSRVLSRTGMTWLSVTTERVLLFSQGTTTFGTDPATGRKTWDAPTELLWQIPQAAVQSAVIKARPFMAGRLVLRFEDGSSAALMCGMFSRRAARRLRDALNPGRG